MKKNADIGYNYLASIEQIIKASNELVRMINEFEEQAANIPELINYYNKTKEDISHFRENFVMKTSVSAQVDTKLKALLKRRRVIKDANDIYFESGLNQTILAARESLEDSCSTFEKIKKTIDNKRYIVRTEAGAEILEFLISSGARMVYPITVNKNDKDLEDNNDSIIINVRDVKDAKEIINSDNNSTNNLNDNHLSNSPNNNLNGILNDSSHDGSDNHSDNRDKNTSNKRDCRVDYAEHLGSDESNDDSVNTLNKNDTVTTIKRNKEKCEWELYRKKQLLISSKKLDDIFKFLAKGNYCKRPIGLPKDIEKVFDARYQKAADSIIL